MAYALDTNGSISIGSTQFDPSAIEVTTLPEDKLFRSAFRLVGTEIQTDLDEAKTITHDKRRAKRELAFAPHDTIISKQIPGQDAVQAEQARVVIRDDDAVMQTAIDACADEVTLRQLIQDEEL